MPELEFKMTHDDERLHPLDIIGIAGFVIACIVACVLWFVVGG